EQRPALEQQIPGLRVVRHRIGAQQQARLAAIERTSPGFRLAAGGTADAKKKVAAVGKKLRREMPTLSLRLINTGERVAGVRPDLHAPQTLVARRGREDDRVVTVPAAAAEQPWRIGDNLRRATGSIHRLQFSLREEGDGLTVG